jgi:CheY-like chemotaxis protein
MTATVPSAAGAPPILVVEDNPTNQFVFAHFLRRIGLPFAIVPNGAEALAAWEGGDYGLVLMDIEMPVMDGYEAARTLRRREAAEDRAGTPIIAVSADAMPETRERARRSGMDAFLTKPIDLDGLRRAIRDALLDRRRPAPAALGD